MKTKLFLMLLAVAVCATATGCNDRPHPGIELGNPDISVNSFRVVAEDSSEVYDVSLIDTINAEVTRTQSSGSETVPVPYRRDNGEVTVEASFSDGRRVGVTTIFDEDGAIESGRLTIDGDDVPACFEVPGVSPKCDVDPELGPALETDDTNDSGDEQPLPIEERTGAPGGETTNIETPEWHLPQPSSPPPSLPLVKKPNLPSSAGTEQPIRLNF